MPTISKKELEDYQQLCKDRKNDPESIGKHMLETLARMQNKERY